jgi:HlyD family secretion protein
VQGLRPGATKGYVTADVSVQGSFPSGVNVGDPIDASIAIGKLNNVVYVGRPVFAEANSAVTLFKLDPDGQHAFRVRVEFGRTSVNAVEVKSGLQPGDHVILSDMKAYDGFDRITVK